MTGPASRGELIAGVMLLMTVFGAIWYVAQDKGAMQRSIDSNMLLLQRRDREIDALREDMRETRREKCNCGERG